MVIVTSGVDAEYVLSPLCTYLRSKGFTVIELDFGKLDKDPHEILKGIANQEVIYITSAHTNLSLDVAKIMAGSFTQYYPNYLSPLELIPILDPKKSIYIPHDLLTPFGDTNLNEFRFLDLFDFILTPFSAHDLQAQLGSRTQVIEAGWIKHAQIKPALESRKNKKSHPPKMALFISMIEHLRWKFGANGVVEYFKPLLGPGVKVKLPDWHHIHEIEALFNHQFPSCIFPAKGSSTDLMLDSGLVICNGTSSILAEANLMGLPAICLLDNEAMSMDEQRKKLEHLPLVFFHDYRNRNPVPENLIERAFNAESNTPCKIFDFGLVEDIIRSH